MSTQERHGQPRKVRAWDSDCRVRQLASSLGSPAQEAIEFDPKISFNDGLLSSVSQPRLQQEHTSSGTVTSVTATAKIHAHSLSRFRPRMNRGPSSESFSFTVVSRLDAEKKSKGCGGLCHITIELKTGGSYSNQVLEINASPQENRSWG